MLRFSGFRFMSILVKEFLQTSRDKLTFAMIIAIPLIQLILFGYAINTTPHHLPTVVVSADNSTITRTIIRGLANTHYFNILNENVTEKQAEAMLDNGRVMFVLHIPPLFTTNLLRGKRPQLLLEADGTDPSAGAAALAASQVLSGRILTPLLKGPLASLNPTSPPFSFVVHAKFNPDQITQYNIVPALLGVVLTMTMVMVTSLALTRERERGTMESLLSTPVQPLEVMLGKIVPYILIGYEQVALILCVAVFLFHVQIVGSLLLLLLAILPFIAANLAVGLTFSSIAKNQLQALQMSFFYFLPSILLSGFMFPFAGMPSWAQVIGNVLPLTHFLRIVRGIILKGNTWVQVWPHIWPLLLFTVGVILIGLSRYRRTLD